MSGPDDRADDPDEVTLWAGRLRSWPAAPTADEQEARSPREDLDDRTVVSRPGPLDDDTARSTFAAEIDEATRPRTSTVGGVDEVTRRRTAEPADDTLRPSVPVDADPTTVPRSRNRRASPAEPVAPPPRDDDTTAGSRRRPAAAAPAVPRARDGGEVSGGVRSATVPAPGERAVYAPLTRQPVRVSRRPSPAPRSVDAESVRARPARRGTLRALLIGAAIVLVAAASIAAALILFG